MTSEKPSQVVKQRLEKLKQVIEKHRYLYHVLDRQEISEEALDSLKNELVTIEAKYPELITADSPSQRVAGLPLEKFEKIEHKVSQWSFNDAFTEEDVKDFDARVKRFLQVSQSTKLTYACELKIDGMHIVLEYLGGLLVMATTRGDGKVGENVLLNVKTIESVPLVLREAVSVLVEGEVWMAKDVFEAINQKRRKEKQPLYANPRNLTAGTMRQLDPQIVAERQLNCFLYDVSYPEKIIPSTQIAELEQLKKWGLKVCSHFEICQGIEAVIAFWKKWQTKKEKENYWIDGIVIKVNDRSFQKKLGYTGKAPRFAIAFKFPAEQVTTTIEEIVLQVGRTGVITPVAHLKPVSLFGSVVSRATLHNADEIERLDVRIGDTVILEKAGDVIPKVVSVLKEMRVGTEKKYTFPKKILACGGDGRIERIPGQVAFRCVSPNSFAQLKRRFYYFVSKKAFDIEGLGPKVIDVLLEENLIVSFEDIFSLKAGDLLSLPRLAEKSVANLLKAIDKARTITLAKFLTSLGIEQVGEETSLDLANHFGSLEKIRTAQIEDLDILDGVGGVIAQAVFKWFQDKDNQKVLDNLLKEIKIINPHLVNKKFKGQRFVLTGSLTSLTRDEAKTKIRNLGGAVSSAVSIQTDYVIAGENSGSKLKKAQELKVKILNETEFLKMLDW